MGQGDPWAQALSDDAVTEIAVGGLRFACRLRGDEGAPVMLLHGFPETSIMWEPLLARLVEQGFRCAAPDQRGYSSGARPVDIAAYGTEHLVSDVFGIADALGWDRFHLVAHDWGACIAWLAAAARPRRLASLTVLSIPHYHAFAEAAWSDPEEEPYRRFLALVLAPDNAAERVLGRNGMATFRAGWTHHAPAEIAATIERLAEHGALSGALAWYRASDGHRRILATPPPAILVPTLLIWGQDDPYVRPAALALGEQLAVADYRRVDLAAGHWLVQERSAEITELVLDQLARHALHEP